MSMDWDQMVAYVKSQSDTFWTMRVYKSYDLELDAHIQWSGDPRVYYYRLHMPYREADGEGETMIKEEEHYVAYPSPQQWYQAIGMTYVGIVDPDEADAAMADAAMADGLAMADGSANADPSITASDGAAMADVVAIPEDPDGDGVAIVDGTAMDGLEEV